MVTVNKELLTGTGPVNNLILIKKGYVKKKMAEQHAILRYCILLIQAYKFPQFGLKLYQINYSITSNRLLKLHGKQRHNLNKLKTFTNVFYI